jgi:hypothetical protein
MGLRYAVKRLRKTAIVALILVMGWIAFPEALDDEWSRFLTFASALLQFDYDRFQMIAVIVVSLGVGVWILLGLLKEED